MRFRKHIFLYLALINLGYAGTVYDNIDYQIYRDFAMNKGQFKVGAKNIVVRRKDGSFKVIDKPMVDFAATDSNGVGTLIDPNYVGGVQHNVGYKEVTYGYKTGHTYKLIDRNDDTTKDYHTPRLNKVVTDVAPTQLNTKEGGINWAKDYEMYMRVGSGTQNVQLEDGSVVNVGGAYKYLTGGILLPEEIWPWPGSFNFEVTRPDSENPLPIRLEGGDSGSPIWGFNKTTQQWELVGFAMAVGISDYYGERHTINLYMPLDKKFLNDRINEDTMPIIFNNGDEDILWGGINGDTNMGTGLISQGDVTWNYDGLKSDVDLATATNEELNHTKHLIFAGEKGNIKLQDSINMGAGKLWFKNDYTVSGITGDETWVGAGIEIDKDKTVLWQVNGVKDDYLHKIGEGTLHVNATGVNEGSLNVGDGTVILDQQADENGNKQAFESIDIVSGRATVVLNSADQIDTSKINFLFRGGRLDVNGNDITFGDINAVDYGAHIINRNESKATVSIDTDKFKGNTSIFHGQFGESDEEKVNGELDVNIGGTSGENKTFAITGGSNLKGDFNLTSGDTTLILSGGRDLHAGEDIKKTTVNGDYYFSEFNYNNINMAEGSELYGSIYSVMNGNINTEGNNNIVLGYIDGESKFVYDSTQETKEQTATETILNSTDSGDRFEEITTFYQGDINLQKGSTLKSGYSQIEGDINSNNSSVSLGNSILFGGLNLENNSSLTLNNTHIQGDIKLDNSDGEITNSYLTGSIVGTNNSLKLNTTSWTVLGDSNISNLELDNSTITFRGKNDTKEGLNFHTITTENFSGSGHLNFRTDLMTGASDKIIVEEMTGDRNELYIDIQNIGEDIAYGETINFLEIKNNNSNELIIKSHDGKDYLEVGPVRVDIVVTEDNGNVGSNIEIPEENEINKGSGYLSSLGNAALGDFSARFSMIKSQKDLIDEAMNDITKENFVSGARYRGNYSDSKYENDKFREYDQTILTHGVTYEVDKTLNEKWDLYKGVAFVYGKSNIDYEGNYSGDLEGYSGQVYAKAISDDGHFIKWNSGINYIRGNMNSDNYDTYSLNAGAGMGIVKDIYGLNIMTGLDLNLYYMPSYDYEIDGWQVDGRDSLISQITPKLRIEKDFYLNEFKFTTYGETNIDYNTYLNGDEPEVEIAKADISTDIIDKGLNIKGGFDVEYKNISVGLELNHFTGKYNSEKTTASLKTTFRF